ncbi:PREDICTED: uncharacterized protein LOC105368607 isoform X2 [Ceratosolen solmsi marchali]|uniref:Uncharacterized protein LOC105368607 isoform X2 n=1 Tax=Ceratosolen solmsi marchali TaxID=326594 RepID=A0AAJ7E301_9HYME|nr:PREDICTED: uncharacterized protein LOC105368607 isoform X2 [Ceratosolen solmsi marchali]
MTDSSQQQQFCLRWNNFQANITSQFEALRDDEDFVDVTFACDGRRLQAHKVVLSACSPYFKELFKTNPCKHPIIFMRDVEFEHLQSLLEFMYAGEVNISQAELPTFLRTAESLQIRGLTDSQSNQHNEKHSKANNINASNGRGLVSPNFDDERSKSPPPSSPPPLKRLCKRSDSPQNSSPATNIPPCATSTPRSRPLIEPQVQLDCYKDTDIVEPKVELPEYGSDDESKQDLNTLPGGFLSLDGGMEVLPSYPPTYSGSGMESGMPGPSHGNTELNQEQQASRRVRRGRPRLGFRGGRQLQTSTHGNSPSRGDWLPLDMRTTPPVMPAFRGFDDSISSDGVVHLGEGIAVCEEQLRAVKWSDYRKLTRGLAAILFSPTELATCSVTGQRWSRAGTATERPVKPALDKAKVQAIISYVTSRFPSVDVSSVKQVLAYKCKENSTALKMKSIRYICERQDMETSLKCETEDK